MELAETTGDSISARGGELSPPEIDRQALAIGLRALAILRSFLARQLTVEELSDHLRNTAASEFLVSHWGWLTSRPEAAPALELLQLIAFLPDQAAYQVARYGASSLADDRDQLVSALRRLGHEGARRETQ